MEIILASNSPRRREILSQVGISFTVIPSEKEEVMTTTVPQELVVELSRQKAEEVASKVSEEALIIGADTVVAIAGKVLGKPRDEDEAIAMIQMLQGKAHSVFTGVTTVRINEDGSMGVNSFYEETKVEVYEMSREEIIEYVRTKEPMDKAGAYAVQGIFAKYIKALNGDYYNVVGFPIGRFYQELKEQQII